MNIDLSRMSEVMNPRFLPLLFDKSSLLVLVGGANSSKSYSAAQKVIYHTIAEPGHRFLAIRKVKKDVKYSVYDTLRDVIIAWGMTDLFRFNQTESSIKCIVNGNDILGVGLDDVNKLKSLRDPTNFWVDEADQATEDDINQLRLRLRGNVPFPLQGILSMNPISAQHWIKKAFFDTQQISVTTHRSTYKDNLHINEQVKTYMEGITDPYYKRVYVDGEWGVFGKGVFSNFVIEDFNYTALDLENVCVGLDFGFSHAQALIMAGFKDGELYVYDELYQKGTINSQFIADAKDYFGQSLYGHDIIADSANPDKIAEWNDFGFRVSAAKKGPGSLRYGIEYLTGLKIHIHSTKCLNLTREIQSYRRKVDKDGNVTENFLEIDDDSIAALRYATESIWAGAGQWSTPSFTAEDLGF